MPRCDWPRGAYLPGTVSAAAHGRRRVEVVRKSSAGELHWGHKDSVIAPVGTGVANVRGGGTRPSGTQLCSSGCSLNPGMQEQAKAESDAVHSW